MVSTTDCWHSQDCLHGLRNVSRFLLLAGFIFTPPFNYFTHFIIALRHILFRLHAEPKLACCQFSTVCYALPYRTISYRSLPAACDISDGQTLEGTELLAFPKAPTKDSKQTSKHRRLQGMHTLLSNIYMSPCSDINTTDTNSTCTVLN